MSKQPKTKEQKAAEKAAKEQKLTATQAEAEAMVNSGEAEIPKEAVVSEKEALATDDAGENKAEAAEAPKEPTEAGFEAALKITGVVPKDKLARAHYKMFYNLGFQDGARK